MKLIVLFALIALVFADTKEDLIRDASKLKQLAEEAIKKLEGQGKHELAAGLSLIEKAIETEEQKLEALDPKTELGKIAQHAAEVVLKALENKLMAEIKKLGLDSFYDSTKDELIADAARLKKLAQEAIEKLKSQGKHELAAGLALIEKAIETEEQKLLALDPKTELGKIAQHAAEVVLKALEDKLIAEIKKLGLDSFYDSTKDELAKEAEKLKKLAQEEIEKLKAEGKHLLAEEVQLLETKIEELEQKIEALDPKTELGKIAQHALEAVLKGLETKLKDLIKQNN